MSGNRILYVLIALALVILAGLTLRSAFATSAMVAPSQDPYDQVERERSLSASMKTTDSSYDDVERIRAARSTDTSYDEVERIRSARAASSSAAKCSTWVTERQGTQSCSTQ